MRKITRTWMAVKRNTLHSIPVFIESVCYRIPEGHMINRATKTKSTAFAVEWNIHTFVYSSLKTWFCICRDLFHWKSCVTWPWLKELHLGSGSFAFRHRHVRPVGEESLLLQGHLSKTTQDAIGPGIDGMRDARSLNRKHFFAYCTSWPPSVHNT